MFGEGYNLPSFFEDKTISFEGYNFPALKDDSFIPFAAFKRFVAMPILFSCTVLYFVVSWAACCFASDLQHHYSDSRARPALPDKLAI